MSAVSATPVLPVAIAALGRLRAPWRFFFVRAAANTACLALIPLLRIAGVPDLVVYTLTALALIALSRVLVTQEPQRMLIRPTDDDSLRAHGNFRERRIERAAEARVTGVRMHDNGQLRLTLAGIDGEVSLEPADFSVRGLEALSRILAAALDGDASALREVATDGGITARSHKGRPVYVVSEKPGFLPVSFAALAVSCTLFAIVLFGLRAGFG